MRYLLVALMIMFQTNAFSADFSAMKVKNVAGTTINPATSDNQGALTPGGATAVGTYLDKFRDEFLVYDTTNNWTTIQTAAGGSIGVAGSALGSSYLKINSGTTSGEETIILSKQTFKVPFKISIGASVTLSSDTSGVATSGRHANLLPIIELVEVDGNGAVVTTASSGTYTGTCPNVMQFAFGGTTVTTQRNTIRGGGVSEITTDTAMGAGSTTLPTGSYPNYIQANNYNFMALTDYVTFQNEPINSVTVGTIVKRSQRVLDPTKEYAIRIRLKNTGVVPAADFNIHSVRVCDASRVSVDFGLIGGNVTDNQIAIPTYSTNMVSVLYTRPVSSYGSSTQHSAIMAASTNETLVSNAVRAINSIVLSNFGTKDVFFKLYNKASAPVLASDTPIKRVMIPAGTTVAFSGGTFSLRLSTGVAYAVTGGITDTDTTAVEANKILVNIDYD